MANSRTTRQRPSGQLGRSGQTAELDEPVSRAIAESLHELDRRLQNPPDAIGVAVSGGRDSIALLHALARCASVRSGRALWVFSVNHGLHPQAGQWVEVANRTAIAVGAQFDSRTVSVSAGRTGIEQAARDQRYAALTEMARSHGVQVVALAHHADDLAETVLLQALRGTGIAGLAAMRSLREYGGLWWWRPALHLARAQLTDYAARNRLDFIDDPSNVDDRYRRNALRLHLAPILDQRFAGWQSNLARLAEHAGEQLELLEEVTRADLDRLREQHRLLGPVLRLSGWAELPSARQRWVLRGWLAEHGLQAPSSARMSEMQRQLLEAGGDSTVILTHQRRRLRRYRDWITFESPRNSSLAKPRGAAIEERFVWSGQPAVALPGFEGRLIFTRIDDRPEPGLALELLSTHELIARSRRGAERLMLQSNRPRRTLKNLFQEAGIPSWRRDGSPLLWSQGRLLWVAGLGADARYTSITGPRVRIDWSAA